MGELHLEIIVDRLKREFKAKTAPEKGGGYSLTDHVQRYYKTTRV